LIPNRHQQDTDMLGICERGLVSKEGVNSGSRESQAGGLSWGRRYNGCAVPVLVECKVSLLLLLMMLLFAPVVSFACAGPPGRAL